KKRLLLTALIATLFFSNPFIFRTIVGPYEKKPVSPGNQQFQAGIVLGGFVSYNAKEKKANFNNASDRFIQTALLYKNHTIQKIIIAAGNGYLVNHDFQEAVFIKDHLVQLGIHEENIFVDPYSRNTYENAVNAKKICDSLHLTGQLALISSAMHLPRAEKLFARQQIDVYPYPCDFITENVANNFWEDYLLPSSVTLHHWENFIKEIAGLMVYKIQGKI
ncbi:MAG: YdcF family protein, partial [Chitinophagaceae bacterium]